MLGRANAGREWLCGGIVEPRPRRKIRSCLGGVIFLGQSHSRCVGAQVGGRGREWLGGDCNHVIARARGEGADKIPWLSAHLRRYRNWKM